MLFHQIILIIFSFCFFIWYTNRGFARFVNLKDDNGATPLHLASRHGRANSVHILLDNGAIVSSPTTTYGYGPILGFPYSSDLNFNFQFWNLVCDFRFPGSTPLHLAARGGWVDCVRELLAWGADRLQRDSAGYFSLFPLFYNSISFSLFFKLLVV